MGLPKRLTEMQMKFAHLLVTNEGRLTGYEPNTHFKEGINEFIQWFREYYQK